MAEKLWTTEVDLVTLIKETEISLSEMSKWKKGYFLPLNMSPEDDVTVFCHEIPLFKGTMGRKANSVVVKVKGKADKDE